MFALSFTEVPLTFNADLIKIPNSLILVSTHNVASGCYSACHRDDGNILLGCKDGVKILNPITMEIIRCDLSYKKVYAVVEHSHSVYLLHQEDNDCRVELCFSNLQVRQTLFDFRFSGNCTPEMAVSDRHVVIYNAHGSTSKKKLLIYSFCYRQTKTIQVATAHSPCLLPDGHLLAAANYQLVKYNIEDSKLTTIWTCEGLKNISRVCTDAHGFIFACAYASVKTIYIISPAGKSLSFIIDQKLPFHLLKKIRKF